MSELSQNSTVLKMLRKARHHGVANYQFQDNRILCYTKRISDLRKLGYNISTERQYLPNGRATGVYKFIINEDDTELDELIQVIAAGKEYDLEKEVKTWL